MARRVRFERSGPGGVPRLPFDRVHQPVGIGDDDQLVGQHRIGRDFEVGGVRPALGAVGVKRADSKIVTAEREELPVDRGGRVDPLAGPRGPVRLPGSSVERVKGTVAVPHERRPVRNHWRCPTVSWPDLTLPEQRRSLLRSADVDRCPGVLPVVLPGGVPLGDLRSASTGLVALRFDSSGIVALRLTPSDIAVPWQPGAAGKETTARNQQVASTGPLHRFDSRSRINKHTERWGTAEQFVAPPSAPTTERQ